MTFVFAWRYFKGKKSTNAVNVIAWISILAIAVGTASLILVLSVFNGFEGLVKTLYADFYTDIKVSSSKGKFIHFKNSELDAIRAINGIKAISCNVEEKAVLVNDQYQSIIFLKGVDEAYSKVSGLARHIFNGSYHLGTKEQPGLFLGAGIENAVAVQAGMNITPLTVYMPNFKSSGFSGLDALNSYNANVTGSFILQQDFDNKYAITNLAFVQYMLDLSADTYSSVEVTLIKGTDADVTKKAIYSLLGPGVKVETRYEQNQSLYTIMQIEKWIIYGILSLILVVAAFNMIGALTMLVLEKQKDIAVLKAMGANDFFIQKIFLNEGLVLALVGAGSGTVIAVVVCMLQLKYKLVKLAGGSFIIDYYPVKMLPLDFILVSSTVFIISLIAAWLPSRKAGRQHFSLKS